MKNILIATKTDDSHAMFVKLALERKGHSATLWYTADFPEKQTHSFELSKKGLRWSASGLDFTVNTDDHYDVIWLRRPQRPILPEYLHPNDVRNAKNENIEFYKSIWQVIAPDAYWINPIANRASASCKLHQLKVAKDVGFHIPESLFSNDPQTIKDFINLNSEGEVIYKPLHPVYWVEDESLHLTYTNVVTEKILPSDPILQSTPGIYQRKISKAYELRATFFGERAITVKLDSQSHKDAKNDWRSVSCFEIDIQEYSLPEEIRQKCVAFMKKIGVVFGCFDFIVTPENEYYFLEINEQGQFLWIEEVNPSIKMLDAFINHLIECAGGVLDPDAGVVSVGDFYQEMKVLRDNAMKIHNDVGLVH